jgi:hypothetical protein
MATALQYFYTEAVLQQFPPTYSLTKKHAHQGRGVHVTGVSAAYTFKLNKNILSE